MKSKSNKAFTLIELLTVIAIIGILAAIIIPTVSSVRTSANKAKTKVQFGQWASAIGLFKQDYGFYPYFSSTAPAANASDTGVNLNSATPRQLFVDVLSGKKPDGSVITGTALTQNKRRATYYSFSDAELSATTSTVNSISDAFGNLEIYVVIDYNYDGMITAGFSAVKGGTTSSEISASTGYTPDMPTGGVRSGVVFYSPGKGGSKTDIVTSW